MALVIIHTSDMPVDWTRKKCILAKDIHFVKHAL